MAEQPGTYLLTDFLARTFEHTVVRELGLDRHPELLDDYFRNYTRVLWLAQRQTPDNQAAAAARRRPDRAAARGAGRWATPGSSARSSGWSSPSGGRAARSRRGWRAGGAAAKGWSQPASCGRSRRRWGRYAAAVRR